MVPGFANIVNYLVTREMPKGETRMIGIVFIPWSDSLHPNDPYLNIVRTRSLEDASLMSTFRVSSPFAMINLVEDTLVRKRLLRRFFKADFIRPPYLEMPMSITNDACTIKKLARYVRKI